MLLAQNVSLDGSAVFGIFFLIFLAFVIGVLGFVFWVFMLIDAAKRKDLSDGERIAWILIIAFIGIIGAIVYYFAVKLSRKR